MNILVTGATGFIGSKFIKYLNERKKEDDNVILLTSREIEGFTCILHHNYTFSVRDFWDRGVQHIDAVIHIGAFVSNNPKERDSAVKHFKTILNTEYLLNNLPNIPDKIVYLSTVAVYGFGFSDVYTDDDKVYSEQTSIQTNSNYARAKYYCEQLIKEYGERYNCKISILRIGNIYGWNSVNFLGYMLKAAVMGKEFHMYAHPQCIWNYVFVNDVIKWIYAALIKESLPEVINLTSSANYTSLQICDLMKLNFKDFNCIIENPEIYYGADRRFNSDVREHYLGEETYNLNDGIQEIKRNAKDVRDSR